MSAPDREMLVCADCAVTAQNEHAATSRPLERDELHARVTGERILCEWCSEDAANLAIVLPRRQAGGRR